MSKLYVCEEYETPFEEGYRQICTLEDHDKQIRQVAYDGGYQKGASDIEKAKQIIIDSLLEQLEQVRAEAIEKFVADYIKEEPNYCDDCKRGEEEYCCIKCFKDKWLKENK